MGIVRQMPTKRTRHLVHANTLDLSEAIVPAVKYDQVVKRNTMSARNSMSLD